MNTDGQSRDRRQQSRSYSPARSRSRPLFSSTLARAIVLINVPGNLAFIEADGTLHPGHDLVNEF